MPLEFEATLCKYHCSHPSIMKRKLGMVRTLLILYPIFFCFYLPCCSAKDTLTLNDSISDRKNETLISASKRFELGFFTPNGSSDNRRYVGIWYIGSNPRRIVWVANRSPSLDKRTGVFCIAKEGKLVVLDGNNEPKWSSGLSGSSSFKGMVKLFDSGNLVLTKEDNGSSTVVWESFRNPTDTFLPGMNMSGNFNLTAWKSHDDPAPGNFIFRKDEDNGNQYTILKDDDDDDEYWRSGVSGNFIKSAVFSVISSMLSNSTESGSDLRNIFKNCSSPSCKIASSSNIDRSNMMLVMNYDGQIQYFIRNNQSDSWPLIWREPRDNCSVFKFCGNNAICNTQKECKCLPKFHMVSSDYSPQGCQRTTPLICNKPSDGNFLKLEMMKLGKPDKEVEAPGEIECRERCLKKCECEAYSFETPNITRRDSRINYTCWLWTEALNNIQENYTDGGRDIYLRWLPDSVVGSNRKEDISDRKFRGTLIALVTMASFTVMVCVIAYSYIQKKKANRQEMQRALGLHLYNSQMHVRDLIDSGQFREEDKKGIDLPFFDFRSVLAATDNFSEANKLGKGGFGPVYKGKFSGGQDIAVKRLSSVSGQGLQEFKNEVVLIAKLQHRNLVRILGYCIERGERILLYEYMPNKSLDFFIFDRTLSLLLDWETRFNIILGITRGLVYLHQDSRLRIIHRDLKTSNILLDHEMNPKISDFGLAKIFEGTQTEGTTNRVVGTYGYMSPEYALDGFFSVKSDVFSFGVVVLEIISGKKNTGFYNSEEALSLLGYAWRLWQEDKALDLIDQKLRESWKTDEILKCINIGLLCVQEDPDDRPTMSMVIVMLGGETVTLPAPKAPAFILKRGTFDMPSSSSSKPESKVEITVSLEGR
ncbi:G-type lectin S-receptor-like serine/threonine-protein kinase At4g03230 isoform X2 [Mangifera indica]|uniref:G-type lectin S-receptor-like serine/threonine-protein kinase At4g03230 isoform X2 n=1 Tax=Mangifera indica TaxID=29780 RepID=UPI001CFAF481|nr:G-type lectin S-receptor-like serine/threonine-protein kinase At4g03230 isoform X2 [Mangifera indica]